MNTGVAASDILSLRQSGEFDEQWYISEYPDVALTGLDPAEHFLWIGAKLGRYPSAASVGTTYLRPNSGAKNRGVPASLGSSSLSLGSSKTIDPSIDLQLYETVESQFDRDYYLTTYPDVAAAGADPVEHYILAGWQEGRDPNPLFSTRYYLDSNRDIVDAGVNPFYHFIIAGQNEGRVGRHSLGFRFDILAQLKPVTEQIADARRGRRNVQISSSAELRSAFEYAAGSSERVIVSFSHDDFSRNVGGVQLLLRRELRLLEKQGISQIHFFPAHPLSFVDVSGDPTVIGILINGVFAGYFGGDDVVSCARFIAQAVKAEPEFVVHSLLGHNVDQVVKIIRSFGARAGYFWLHDYAALYNNYKLLRNDVAYCGVPKPGTIAYDLCEYTKAPFSQARECAKLFEAFEVRLISPSQAALDIWEEAGLHHCSATTVLNHCQLVSTKVEQGRAAPSGPLKVGFLGYPVDHKGWPVFRELVLKFANDERYSFYHLGKGRRGGLPLTYIEVVGDENNPDAMRDAVARSGLDVALVWSMWPETFCLIAYEAIAGGAVVLTNEDAGNVSSLATEMDSGEVIDGESRLAELFQSGEILKYGRAQRPVQNYKLEYSDMTVSLLGLTQA